MGWSSVRDEEVEEEEEEREEPVPAEGAEAAGGGEDKSLWAAFCWSCSIAADGV